MRRYANETTVAPEKSRAEIESSLRRYGASQFMSGWEADRAYVAFTAKERFIRFVLRLPKKDEKRFLFGGRYGGRLTPEKTSQLWEQAVRQSWRALLLCIKAKLEAVEARIETFEEAFLPHIVLPSGQTMAEAIIPQLEEAYKGGEIPRLIPALPAPKETP